MKMLTVLIKDSDTDEHYAYQVKLTSYSNDASVYVSLLSLDQHIQYYHEIYIFPDNKIGINFTNEFNIADAKKFAKRYRRYNNLFAPDGIKI